MPIPDSFETMLIAHLPRLKAYAIMLTRNRALADDLLQETAYRALRFRDKFIAGTNFAAWTYRILRNEFITTLRRSKGTIVGLDEMPPEFIGKAAEQDDIVLTQEILRAMGKLRVQEREILMLISAGDLTYDEAAEHIKVSTGTVRSRLWRARKNLAHLLLGDAPRKSVARRGDQSQPQKPRFLADGLA